MNLSNLMRLQLSCPPQIYFQKRQIINSNSISKKGLAIFNINNVIGNKTSVQLSFIKDMNPEEKLGWHGVVISIKQRFQRFTSKSYLNQISVPFVRISK